MAPSKLLLAGGHIIPMLEKFVLDREDFFRIWHRLTNTIHPGDLIALILVAFGCVPIVQLMFGRDSRYATLIASHVSQAASLAIVVYIFDCLVVILTSIGFSFSALSTYSKGLAKILYIGWLAQRLSVFKRYLVGRAVSRSPLKLGRAATVDRLLDGLIVCGTGFFLLDVLDVDMGVGITSIFAFGSAGTLVIGLASQNLAAMFVNGLVLTTSDRIAEGDHIQFGNGNNGQVTKIGWFQTTLKHYDELYTVIPNSELGMQRVTNKSRVKKCRVRQTLRFHYDDAPKFDALFPDILKEIQKSCPNVIVDGSAVFRCTWTNFKEDYLEVVCEAHFDDIPPMGDKFWINKQECLKAIYRAVMKHDMKFVTGLYPQGINKK